MKILTCLLFYVIGFVSVFGACYLMRRVFRWKLKSSLLASALGGAAATLYYIIAATVNLDLCMILYVPLIWLLVTDRSLRSFVVSLSACVFITYTSLLMRTPINIITFYIAENIHSPTIVYATQLLGELSTLLLAVLFGKIGKSGLTEPMTVWNTLFVGLLSFFTVNLYMFAFDYEIAGLSDTNTRNSLLFSLLSLAFICIAVVMTVKLTESRYYSTLSRMNESYLNAQKDYYEMKQTSDTEIRRIRHDMKNHLICIRELAAQRKYDELENYVGEISAAVKDADRLIHTGSGIIDAIVNEKAAIAKKAGVHFEWEGTISGLEISAVDSCTLVSNLLDNALEACDLVNVADRFISLTFRRSEHFLFMICENSSARVIEMSGGRPITTKSDKLNHGFGIRNISRCVEKYGGELKLSSELKDGSPTFTAQAIIPI